jgi:chromate transporter
MQPQISPIQTPPTRLAFFLAFLKIGVFGFGGVAPWARRVLVEEKRWLTDEEFAAVLGIGQILPGANVVNASVILGDRYFGPVGSLLAFSGIMGPPLAILIAIAAVYDRFEAVPDVQAALAGMAAAGAGLVIGTSLRIARGLRRDVLTAALGVAALVAVMFKAPLVLIVLVLAPLGLGIRLRGRA